MADIGRFSALAKTFTRRNLPESEVELSGEVPYEALAPYRDAALAHMASRTEMPGFRPGKVPKDMVLKKVGEVGVLEEAAELFVKDFYPELVMEHTVDAVGRPDIRITKLAPYNPVALVVRATIYPEVLVDRGWKNLHETVAAEPALPATEEEVQKTLEDLRASRKKDDAVPELNDEFAKSVGAFETIGALTEQIRKGITEEKARRAKEARRGKLIEALLAIVTVAVPRIFIESELEKIMAQMREDVSRFSAQGGSASGRGFTWEDYLKAVSKTEESIRNEFREQAAKRAKLQLTLNKLAEEEKVEADKELVEQEMKHALEHFPDAKPELVRIHIETVLRNEKVLKILEGEK
ncbi:MAG: trigger factor [Patescibacteria group bacterium]